MNQTQQGSDGNRGGSGAGVILLVARALACSVEVFLHKSSSFGERYLGAQAAVAALIIFIFPVLGPEQDPEPLLWFLGAYLVMCAAAREGIVARRKRGELGPHSFYTGTPRLMGRLAEKTVKGGVEPVVVWVASALLSDLSPLLAGYLAVAGCGLLMSVQLTLAAERKRVLDMHDAYMEQRRTAEDWRAMHRE
jgi:hypothetical protein